MPKFEFEFATSLATNLKALGMTDAFDPDRADFTGMLDEGADAEDGLVISDVLHKAFIAVDEAGTEAAAATVIMMEATSAQPEEKPEPIEVRVDRPFLFAIRPAPSSSWDGSWIPHRKGNCRPRREENDL
jgi:serpin B